MYDHLLFPTDGSEPADAVFDYALRIAGEHDATVHVLSVADTGRADDRDDAAGTAPLEAEARRFVDDAAARAADRDVRVATAVRRGDPHESIVEYAEQSGVGCIVMATHGRRGLRRVLLGSVTERVINTAGVPVVAVNVDPDRRPAYPPADVLVPVDGSPGADRALTEGIGVAAATGATLHLLHVVETGSLAPALRSLIEESDLRERAGDIVAEAARTAAAESLEPRTEVLADAEPARAIRGYIEDNDIGLAVLGTHGRTDFSRHVMGGVSAKLVRTSPVPVMWVRQPEGDAAPDPS